MNDCTIVGASFAGLACATALARAGVRVSVLEKRADVGEKLHTTGIIVKDAIDQLTILDGLPEALVHRVTAVRLYAPNLEFVDLQAPGYYFLATDTPQVMRWLAERAQQAGARIGCRAVRGRLRPRRARHDPLPGRRRRAKLDCREDFRTGTEQPVPVRCGI
jgi:flavin-dependent dehydrogenase